MTNPLSLFRDAPAWRRAMYASLAAFAVALPLPAFVSIPAPGVVPFYKSGLECLMTGWIAAFMVPALYFPWTANVFYLLLLLRVRQGPDPRPRPLLSLLPFALSLGVFRLRSMQNNPEFDRSVAVRLGSGAYLWMASLLLMATAFHLRRRAPAAPSPSR
jgi:hypothetical protein